MFIVFEGLDGSGKSTLIKSFLKDLDKAQKPFEFVVDPGGTAIGGKIRELLLDPEQKPSPLCELLLYKASRAELVEKKIKPALNQGKWVISDRFYPSTLSFQGYARGLDLKNIELLNELVAGQVRPDYIFWVNTPLEECQRRMGKRASEGEELSRLDQEKIEFHQKVFQGYKSQLQKDPFSNWIELDGMKSPEKIYQDFSNKIKGLDLGL